jgi:hypothetical protein
MHVAKCTEAPAHLPQGPVHPHLQRLLQVLGRGGDDALAAHPHGNVIKERLRQLLLHTLHVRLHEVGANEAHAAVYVEPHAAGRDDGRWIGDVKGGHVANGESVARVDVREGNGLLQVCVRAWRRWRGRGRDVFV